MPLLIAYHILTVGTADNCQVFQADIFEKQINCWLALLFFFIGLQSSKWTGVISVCPHLRHIIRLLITLLNNLNLRLHYVLVFVRYLFETFINWSFFLTILGPG